LRSVFDLGDDQGDAPIAVKAMGKTPSVIHQISGWGLDKHWRRLKPGAGIVFSRMAAQVIAGKKISSDRNVFGPSAYILGF
jgi:hypothetical protein